MLKKTKKRILRFFLFLNPILISSTFVSCSIFSNSKFSNYGNDRSTWNWNPDSDKFRIVIPNPDYKDNKNVDRIIYDVDKFQTYSNSPSVPSNPENKKENLGWNSPNKNYENNFKTSYSIRIENTHFDSDIGAYVPSVVLGTGWILDYKIPKDDSYPTTFYIATNLHVAADIYNKNNLLTNSNLSLDPDPSYYEKENHPYTSRISLTNWNINEDKKINTKNEFDYSIAKSYATDFYDKNSNIKTKFENSKLAKLPKTVFIGVDYLNDSPKNWNKYLSNEEAIDFAVIEIEFKTPEIAREATNNYANDKSIQFKYLDKKDLLTLSREGQNIDVPNYFLSGFPNGEPRINKFEHLDSKNKDNYFLNGDELSKLNNYSSFELEDPKGIGDSLLMFPYFRVSYGSQSYNLWGLTYSFKNSGLKGGSSGSKITNENNEIVAIHAIGSNSENSDIAFALKSNGHEHKDFNGYITPAYDLIFGNVEGQKNSYKDSLKKIYQGENISTHLLGKL